MRRGLAVLVARPARRAVCQQDLGERDAVASRQIKNLLTQYVKGGGTVFLTSHILEIVERLCDHIGVIQKGRLVAQGPLADLRVRAGASRTLEELLLDLVGAEQAAAPSLEWLAR